MKISYTKKIKRSYLHVSSQDFSLNPMSLECATIFAAAFVRCKEKPQTLIVNSCGFTGPSAEKVSSNKYIGKIGFYTIAGIFRPLTYSYISFNFDAL